MIVQQIQEREAVRLVEQEKQEQEAAAMVQRLKEMEQQEMQAQVVKVEKGRRLMDEVRVENDRQARRKILLKQREIEEDKKIAEYLRYGEEREQLFCFLLCNSFVFCVFIL